MQYANIEQNIVPNYMWRIVFQYNFTVCEKKTDINGIWLLSLISDFCF